MAADGPWELMPAADVAAGRPETHTQDIVLQIMCTQGKFVAAYESRLVSRNARFDHYVAGDEDALSLKEKMGLKLFVGKASCWTAIAARSSLISSFTISASLRLARTSLPPTTGASTRSRSRPRAPVDPNGPFSDDPSVDWLDGLVENDRDDKGAFRTATLRNVAQSAPYMHTGGFITLRDVVDFYNRGADTRGSAAPSTRASGRSG